ncbi:ABC transporter ATP-binding protein/permease [Sedimentibacter sp. zth1]|uniref:ABC transporter ATP-binding protein/permease n=1 Tax=Sedimentibacter sp. zth1 TaxID=2816908 RepID=UPI001A91713F|nr:ABC transporter ATP-binding protein/permease [Sedimentibacter sp. zth1]QSX04935.1 ABC transporter ATP-binding protein/permease [Sedimentibacter sp. zth1]
MIKVNNLDKYFNKSKQNELHVINNVSIELPDTGMICILGESGSGKTTLVNAIGGLDNFKKGTINAFGTTVNKSNIKTYEKVRNKNYSYIFQNYYLLGEQSVYENIKIALNMYEITEEDKKDRINKALEAVGMIKYKKRFVSQLSGGQQQRVAIARALVKSPRVIFADEPTGNLDEVNTMKIMSILKKVSENCLIVLVTHEKRLANFFADRIIEISDGKVISDELMSTDKKCYSYVDDNNIYLKELSKHSNDDDYLKYNYYTYDKTKKLNLNIVFENGKFFINSTDNIDVVLLSNDTEKQMIDDYKPRIELSDIENTDYSMSKIDQVKSPKLSVGELFRLAISNIKMYGKKQIFLVASLVIMAILLTITVQDVLTLSSIDIGSIVTNDSHYLTVEVKKGDFIRSSEIDREFEMIYDDFKKSNLYSEIYVDNTINLEYIYSGFKQVEGVKVIVTGFTYVPLEHLKQDDILYGRMPEKPNEIVIDMQIANRFIKNNKLLSILFNSPQSLLNKNFTTNKKVIPYVVVGVSDTNESSVYIDKVAGLGLLGWCNQVASLSSLQSFSPGTYDDVLLGSNETIVKNEYKVSKKTFRTNYYKYLDIVDFLPNDFPAIYIINDKHYDDVLKELVSYNRTFKVYTNNKKEVKKYFENYISEEMKGKLQIVVTDNYAKELAKYKSARSIKLNARFIITLTIFIVCLVILYFTMKSNALKNIKNIAVYRLLGITKSSISLLFIFENIIISTYTSLIGVLATTSVLKFLESIPSLEISFTYPWYAIVATILFLYFLNIIIGIIPVCNILRLTPVQITSKYDM